MKKHYLLSVIAVIATLSCYGQNVWISPDSTYSPNSSAMLEVHSTDKGVLIPRMALDDASTAAPVSTPAEGLMIYNDGGAEPEGFWYWTGTKWVRFASNDGTVDIERFPMGEVFMEGNSTATAIGNTTTYYKAAGTTTLGSTYNMDNAAGISNRLRYTGSKTKMFHVAVTFSAYSAGSNDIMYARVYKNGVPLNNCLVSAKLGGSGDRTSTAIHVMANLAQNDYLELYVRNSSAASNITVTELNFFAMGVSMGMDF